MRKKKGGGGGGANWMDTYGDMVTLLLCFFVLLYSMSTINEENWKNIVMSFNPDAKLVPTETSGDGGHNADPNDIEGEGLTIDEQQAQVDNDIEALYQAITQYVQAQNLENSISVSKADGKLYVTFDDVIFFNGDDWHLREESKPILDSIAEMIKNVSGSVSDIRVLGHTARARDNSPNNVEEDRLLSAERAAIALAYIQERCGVDPGRMVSEGYGEHHPVADNDTEEGKSKNRRVEMIISGRDIEEEMSGEIRSYTVKKEG